MISLPSPQLGINSLLRIDRLASSPPPPFERPSQSGDFAVLELGAHSDVEALSLHVTQVLHKHEAALRDLQQAGASVVLFVESLSTTPVKFPAKLLRALADTGVTLEYYAREKA